MRTAIKLFVLSALLIGYSSCKTFKDLSKQKDGDDVYFSMKDAKKERAAEKKRKEEEEKRAAEEAQKRQAEQNNAKAMATSPGTDYYEQPFDYDDYYDYEYAARLRRFHNPTPGAGYYDNYYTNSYYYNQNPYYYGTSLYNSYSFWGPSAYAYNYCPSSYFYYNSGWAWGTGMYYGNPYGSPYGYGYYDPWMNQGWGYNPYYSYYPGWNSGGWYGPMTPVYAGYWGGPWMGYGNGNGGYGYGGFGYNNGYGNNNGNYYFNSYDENSYYYGPRHSPTSTDGRVAGTGGPAFGERYANANNIQNAELSDINRNTQETFTASAADNTGRTNADPSYVPPMTNTQPANTNAGRDAAPSNSQTQTQQRYDVPPAPVYNNTSSPGTTQQRDQTPPAPDYSRPSQTNTQVQPAPSNSQSRGNDSPSYSAPAPASNGGGNSGGSRNSNSGGSGNRPR